MLVLGPSSSASSTSGLYQLVYAVEGKKCSNLRGSSVEGECNVRVYCKGGMRRCVVAMG